MSNADRSKGNTKRDNFLLRTVRCMIRIMGEITPRRKTDKRQQAWAAETNRLWLPAAKANYYRDKNGRCPD